MKLDLLFQLKGEFLPLDHGYHLFSAICKHIPQLHERPDVFVLPVSGVHEQFRLKLTEKSYLRIRSPYDFLLSLSQLSGNILQVGDAKVEIGDISWRSLQPFQYLYSRLVTIKNFFEPEEFLEKVEKDLQKLGIRAGVVVPKPEGSVVKICGKNIKGFPLLVYGLTPYESLTLQNFGLGGRHHHGCGIFTPAAKGMIREYLGQA